MAEQAWLSLTGSVPEGFRGSERRADVGDGAGFAAFADALMAWQVQREAGVTILEGPGVATTGATVIARAKWIPVRIRCRVAAVVDEPARRGFVYITAPGHSLDGEEAFVAELIDGRTVFVVREFSRPARWFARLPGARAIQRHALDRYVPAAHRVMIRLAAER